MRRPATTDHSECEAERRRTTEHNRESVSKRVAVRSTALRYIHRSPFVVGRPSHTIHTTHENAWSVDERKRKTAAAQSQVAELVWES